MRVVVVGGSVAGIRTAQALRAEGMDGEITVVEAEDHMPYDKPPLSKATLFGDVPEPAPLLSREECQRSGIDLRLATVAVAVDVERRAVTLSDGDRLHYDALVLATGAGARRSPWGENPGIHYLRTLDDCLRLRDDLAAGGPLVIVGGGFIGGEVAGGARRLGLDVTLVDPLAHPSERAVGSVLAPSFTALHRRHGVDVRFGHTVESVTGAARDLCVELSDGSRLSAPTVLVAIGASAHVGWLGGSGIPIGDGIPCDNTGQVIGVQGVRAVGDVAAWSTQGDRRSRIEHWTNAVDQAQVVARHITRPHEPVPHRPDRYVWSDQHDWKAQLVGEPGRGAGMRVLGGFDGESARGIAVFHDGFDGIVGCVTVNWPRASILVRRGMAERVPSSSGLRSLTRNSNK